METQEKCANDATQENGKKRIVQEQERIIKDLDDITQIIEKDVHDKHSQEAMYFEPIYHKAKELKNKLMNDLSVEADL